MKKLVKRLIAAAAVVAFTLPLFACKPSKKPPDTGKNSKMFMENDFVNDKNLLPARVKEVTVTFASGATFKDGSTSKKCVVGDTLKFGDDILYTGVLGEGKTIGGYFDENNVFYKGANYTVTRNDVALTPAPDVLESQYAPKSGGEKGGKIGTGEEREDGGNNKTAYRKEWRDGIVGRNISFCRRDEGSRRPRRKNPRRILFYQSNALSGDCGKRILRRLSRSKSRTRRRYR